MDADGYPEQDDLKRIEEWSYEDLGGLIDFIRELWRYAEDGCFEADRRVYRLSTAGWSGNEDIIYSLQRNAMFWALCWESSQRRRWLVSAI